METKSDIYFRRVVAGITALVITISFYGWTGPLNHVEDPWNTLFYTACVAYAVYNYVSNQIKKDTLKEKKRQKEKESETEA